VLLKVVVAELPEGVAELAKGVAELAEGVAELAEGVAELAEGVAGLLDDVAVSEVVVALNVIAELLEGVVVAPPEGVGAVTVGSFGKGKNGTAVVVVVVVVVVIFMHVADSRMPLPSEHVAS